LTLLNFAPAGMQAAVVAHGGLDFLLRFFETRDRDWIADILKVFETSRHWAQQLSRSTKESVSWSSRSRKIWKRRRSRMC
jgi:hypothetical protein